MARSSTVDPLEKFRFIVSWTETGSSNSEPTSSPKVGFHDIQMPKRTTNKITYRDGADPDISQISPGLSTMEDIEMSRGLIANDANNLFYSWASSIHKPTEGHVSRLALEVTPQNGRNEYKKDVTITMLNREGSEARRWVLYNAFPVNFVPGSDLDASEDGEKSLEKLTLAYEDFQEINISSNKPFFQAE